ncbi:MAG: DUF3299 domain-containing protein [Burkholderiales bacterium]|nr:DUF3299 domain-containing protein [Burkholderiales bacterium]
MALAAIACLAGCDREPVPPSTSFAQAKEAVERAAPQGSSSTAPRQLAWDDLIPESWDPAQALAGENFAGLDDSDPRAAQALARLQREWSAAPVETALHGQQVRIPGFVVPLETHGRNITEFLLVPYFGACIHTPPPPANQIIHVLRGDESLRIETMDAVWVTGVIETVPNQTSMGHSGYRIASARIERYDPDRP